MSEFHRRFRHAHRERRSVRADLASQVGCRAGVTYVLNEDRGRRGAAKVPVEHWCDAGTFTTWVL
jgi:hypothetical protein